MTDPIPAPTALHRLLPPATGLARATTAVVTETLRQAISRGVLPPGLPLRQDHIAGHFQISHIPVREALQQLVAEGLAEFARNRGVTVSALSVATVRELTEFRCLVEAELLRLAVPRLDDPTLDAAAATLDRLDQATALDDRLDLNAEFHATLYRAADRPFFLAEVDRVRLNLRRYWRLAWIDRQPSPQPASQSEHRQILALCRAGRADAAAAELAAHIRATGALVAATLAAPS